MTDVVLIVDDEATVRRTFFEQLSAANLGCELLQASDAESALQLAAARPIDLAVLDWNLGAGVDGLRLLEDLTEFHPDLVAILITGYADRATPLAALRLGVRDYFDKNQDLTRERLAAAVRKQLAQLRPAKQQRELVRRSQAFQATLTEALALVETAATWSEPLALPAAAVAVLRFVQTLSGATDGVLWVQQRGTWQLYRANGAAVPTPNFARSLAATALARQSVSRVSAEAERLPFEPAGSSIVLLPASGPIVAELFDVPPQADLASVQAGLEVVSGLLQQAQAERASQQALVQAVRSALAAGTAVTAPLHSRELLARLQADWTVSTPGPNPHALVEAVRVLAERHGQAALDHCVQLVRATSALLDLTTGAGA
jgi:DNA-binding NarL/FixJ family response regulator